MKQKVKNITYLYITSQINLDSKKNRDLRKQNTYLDRQQIQHKFKLEGSRERKWKVLEEEEEEEAFKDGS